MSRERCRRDLFCAVVIAGASLSACGGGSGPAGPTPSGDLVASGTVTDRIAGGQIDGSTITFTGPAARSGTVTNGTYRVDGLASGLYTVTIDGPRHGTTVGCGAGEKGAIRAGRVVSCPRNA